MTDDQPVTDRRQSDRCAGCYVELNPDDIVRWNEKAWTAWCWPCFKRTHLPNLTRLQEDK